MQQFRRHAQPVSICQARRVWRVTLGRTKLRLVLKLAKVALQTHILVLLLLLQQIVCATLAMIKSVQTRLSANYKLAQQGRRGQAAAALCALLANTRP